MVTAGWKYIHLPEPELYDRAHDADEATNLATAQPDRVAALERERLAMGEPRIDPGCRRSPLTRRPSVGSARSVTSPRRHAARSRAAGYSVADDPKRLVAVERAIQQPRSRPTTAGRAAESLAMLQAVLAERPDFVTARTSAATVLLATGRARDAVALLRAAPGGGQRDAEIQAKLGAALRDAGDLDGRGGRPRAGSRRWATPIPSAPTTSASSTRGWAAPRTPGASSGACWRSTRARPVPGTTLACSSCRPDGTTPRPRRSGRRSPPIPTYGDAWQGLGAALAGRDRAGAIDAWRRAERLLPHDYDLLFNLAVALADSGRPAEALPYVDRFLAEAPPARYGRDLQQMRALRARLTR